MPLLDTYTGASAAYSLRNLSSSTTNVVRVRRSSNDDEQDFTASEVSGGALATFVVLVMMALLQRGMTKCLSRNYQVLMAQA